MSSVSCCTLVVYNWLVVMQNKKNKNKNRLVLIESRAGGVKKAKCKP